MRAFPAHEARVSVPRRTGKDVANNQFSDERAASGVDSTIWRPFLRRMTLNRTECVADYIELLKHSPSEETELFNDIVINVTDFVRDSEPFEAQRVRLEAQNQQLREMQRLLEESRDRYAQLYEFSPVGYVTLDESGYVQVANLTASLMFGAERERLIGQPLSQYVSNEDRHRLRTHLEHCRAGMPLVKTELRLKTGRGHRDIELISVIRGRHDVEDEGRLYRTAMMDLTESKHATEALRVSESRLRWLIDNMPAVLWIRDERGGIRYVSANVSHALGYAEDEVRAGGSDFWNDNVHPNDRERVQAAYARMFETAEAGGPAAYDIEYRRRTKDGDWVWVMDRGMSVGEENGVRYATGMFSDTTRRKRMQEQLRESEERFRQLAENINEVFFLTDVRGGRIYYVSPAFQKVWGYSTDALYRDAASWIELVHEADRRRVRRIVRARRPDMPYDVEFRSRRPDGALRWIRLRGFPIRDTAGNVLRVAGIASDITARKEAADSLQRAHQQMRALAVHLQGAREEERKRIAREIHDELGALLLAIKMDAEACRKNGSSTNGDSAGILQQLVARIDAAIDSVRRIATDLRPSILDNLGVLAAVEWEAQDVERRTGIKCVVETDAEKEDPCLAPEQATAIFRIVQEALANVVRHSGATRVRIVLREEAGNIKLQIKDNGKGIDFEGRPDSRQWGLVGMAERVSAFNGQFRIDRARPRGTIVTAVIPAGSARELQPRL